MVEKLKYAVPFGILFGILVTVSFLGGLMVSLQFAPAPVSVALFDLIYFAPVMGVGALILGIIEAFVSLWLYAKHVKWVWPFVIVIAIVLGGVASFFSLWLIWVLVALFNILLSWGLFQLIDLHHLKKTKHA